MTDTRRTPSREDTWARYPDDAQQILLASVAPERRCRQTGCQARIYWGFTRANNKRCPFDIRPDGTRTGTSHWRTCTDRPRKE